jgi:hypothetical protein
MAIQAYQLGSGDTLILPQGLNAAALAAGSYNNEIITSFDREMFRKVYATRDMVDRHPHRDKFFFADFLKYLGFFMPVAAGAEGIYGHWERDWIRQTVVIDSSGVSGAGGAGADVTFEVDTTTVYTDGLGNISSYVRPRETLVFQFGSTTIVNAWVKSVTPNLAGTSFVVTIAPDDSSLDLLTLLGGSGGSQGLEIAVGSTAYAEGSRQGKGRQVRQIRYENQLQIIKDDDIITGSHMTRAFEVETVPLDSGGRVGYEVKGEYEAMDRFRYQRDSAILIGTRNDNYNENDVNAVDPELVGAPVRTTQGVIPFALQNGHINPYATDITDSDFDSINDTLNAEAAPLDYLVCHGATYGQLIRKFGKQYLGDTVRNEYISQTLFGGKGVSKEVANSLAISIGFHSIQLQGSSRVFHFKAIDSFNDPKGLGASAYNFKDMAFFMPYGQIKNEMPKAQQTAIYGDLYDASTVPYIGYVYSAKKGYNREVESWFTGSAGNKVRPTDDQDVQRFHLRGEFGGHGAAGNLFLTHYPSGSSVI